MSNITYTPETKAQLDAWINACPRELANFVYVVTCQQKDDGNIANLGIFSIHETSTYDVFGMIDETIKRLNAEKMKLILRMSQSEEEED